MDVPQILNNVFWAVTVLLEIGLLLLGSRRGLQKSHPVFLAYILTAILQSMVIAASYRIWGADSWYSYFIAWGSQSVVTSARWIAVIEIARNTIGQYTGIWALSKRMFLVVSVGVFGYALWSSKSKFDLVVLTGDRALELCIAAFIVSMLVFVRYYRVPMSQMNRVMAIGFCLYSSFRVVNDALFEHWLFKMGQFWNYLQMLTFLATLILWVGAVWKYSAVREVKAQPAVSPGVYGELSPKVNNRLQALNNRLNQLFRSRGTQL